MVSTTCEGDASRGWLVWRMKERASFTNAVVSTAPAPIRNPRRDCSIKKSSKIAHASGGLATYCCPCGPHRRATVAGLRLVGGAVRPSQDARLLLPQVLALSKPEQKSDKKGAQIDIFPSSWMAANSA